MRLQVTKVSDGPGPSEVVVEIATASGITEEVVIHAGAIEGDTIDVGYPINNVEDRSLVELPQEAMSGKWRVWVPTDGLKND